MPFWKARARDVVVVVLGGGRGTRLEPLTLRRAKPAVPVGGKYRLIDIPLSNALHSGMERMFVLTQYNSVSLHRHIVRTYRFDAFSRGFVQILAAQQTPSDDRWFQGTADAVRQNLDFITRLRGDLVLILSGDHLYRMDYRGMLRDHVESGAQVTLSVLPCSEKEIAEFGAVRVDESGRILEFREKPKDAAAREGMTASRQLLASEGIPVDRPYLASMGVYLFDKSLLRECLDNDFVDFGRDVLPAYVGPRKVQAHFFNGYWRDIGTVRTFYDAHMDLLRPEPPFRFHDPEWPIYTHPRYLPGARLDGVRFERSVLAEGTEVTNSTVEESIVGIRSVLRGAKVVRSLIMGADDYAPAGATVVPPVGIGEGSVIEGAIVDLNARIGRGVKITNPGRLETAKGDGWEIRDGVVVVTKGSIIPDGTVI